MSNELYSKIHSTTKFSGREEENWETWIFRFETRFGDLEKTKLATALLDLLDGAALDICGNLDKRARSDYRELKGVLQEKFGSSCDTRRARAQLRLIRQLPEENIELFADRVRKLTNLAHPGLSSEQVDHIALDHFLCGLSDLKLQEKLHNDHTVLSLQKAEEVVQRLWEKDLTLAVMRASAGHDTAVAISSEEAQSIEGGQAPDILTILGELRSELNEMKVQLTEHRKPTGSRRGVCYLCGDTAHFKRDCPQFSNRHKRTARAATPRAKLSAIPPGIPCQGCGRYGHALPEC